ncbi:MAG: DNA methyltransferase [Candidatus Zixiibacteriota bacterium]
MKTSAVIVAPRAYPTEAREFLEQSYSSLVVTNQELSRQLVSFQANKATPFFRWFKYKEGFSRPLIEYIISRLCPEPGVLLDPFAGAGSALLAARALGWKGVGIELLPVGIYALRARLAAEGIDEHTFCEAVKCIRTDFLSKRASGSRAFEHVTITQGAFPDDTERQLHSYLEFVRSHYSDDRVRTLLEFAAYSILESISYTRKDGQYLRWDRRSGRSNGSNGFDKGAILSFRTAIERQLNLMCEDLCITPSDLFDTTGESSGLNGPEIEIYEDTCLTKLRDLRARSVDLILTSPPYCNRYDYTRTYALELVFLGAGEERIRELRQAMLSCTVENREKIEQLEAFYRDRHALPLFEAAKVAFEGQAALHEVIDILEEERRCGQLNNPGIVRMVRNYFLEMSLVIHECSRVMKPGAYFVMVNDNVSYNGQVVPVDLILSEIARKAGLEVQVIWKLVKGKGNSSQQMGRHGRQEVRKCVYVWRKPTKKSTSLPELKPASPKLSSPRNRAFRS